jgi:membrane-associated PAP2 superfamily phosphatase
MATHSDPQFWRRHAVWPLAGFALVFAAIEYFGLDRPIANALFFDAATAHWLGTGAGDWWAHALIHDGGRWVLRIFAALALLLWSLSFKVARLRPWRRPLGFVLLAMTLSVLLVGLLKQFTNVDCPWDLAGYGGKNPYVALFDDRPDALPRAKCFPGAHSSSGFALFCFYFVLRDGARRAAYWALAGAILVGVVFSFGQEARGAHFLSHDLTSAAIVWFVQLGLYAWLLKARSR